MPPFRYLALSLLAPLVTVAAPIGAQQATITNAGSERAFKVGDVTVSRPFGATLVDDVRIVGRYEVSGAPVWLLRGDGDARCPNYYVVVARRSARDIVSSDVFGNCAAAGTPRVVAGELVVPFAAGPDGVAARYGYRAGQVRLLTAAGPVAVAPPAPTLPGLTPGCLPASAVDPATQAAAVDDFRANFPREYRRLSSLGRAEIAPAEFRILVTGLACLSSWPAAHRIVAKEATNLFISKRWGRDAFNMLDAVARDPATDVNLAAAAKTFSADMNYRVRARDVFGRFL